MSKKAKRAQKAFDAAWAAAESGDHARAAKLFRVASSEAHFPEAIFNRGNALNAQGKFKGAIRAHREAARAGEDDAWLNLGIDYLRVGRLKKAAKAFRRAIRAGDLAGWGCLAETCWYQDEYKRAQRVGRKGLKHVLTNVEPADPLRSDPDLAPRDLNVVVEVLNGVLAAAQWRLTRDPSLRADLERTALAFDGASRSLSELEMAAGNNEAAVAALERATADGFTDLWLVLGNLLWELDRLPEAKAAFRQGIASGDAYSSNNLGLLLLEQGKKRKAIKRLKYAAKRGDRKAQRTLRRLKA